MTSQRAASAGGARAGADVEQGEGAGGGAAYHGDEQSRLGAGNKHSRRHGKAASAEVGMAQHILDGLVVGYPCHNFLQICSLVCG